MDEQRLLPLGQRIAVLLPHDVIAEIERIRVDLTELIWNGLPTASQLRIRRERRGARNPTNEDPPLVA